MPVRNKSVLGRILAHRRDSDAVAQRQPAQRESLQEHNRKITGPHCRAPTAKAHPAAMGKIILVLLAASSAAHSGGREGIERTTRAHEAYVAGRFAEAAEGYRAALEAFGPEISLPRAIAL